MMAVVLAVVIPVVLAVVEAPVKALVVGARAAAPISVLQLVDPAANQDALTTVARAAQVSAGAAPVDVEVNVVPAVVPHATRHVSPVAMVAACRAPTVVQEPVTWVVRPPVASCVSLAVRTPATHTAEGTVAVIAMRVVILVAVQVVMPIVARHAVSALTRSDPTG